MLDEIIADVEDRMKKSISALEKDFVAIRTGRANPAIFDGVKVDVYGSPMPLNQVATISCPEPRLVVINPWDKGNLGEIEKAILKSDLSLNPSSDGNLIRIQIPDLTEERRKEYVKLAKNKAEDCRVAIRNIRRDGNDTIKELEKEKEISEDDSKNYQARVQKITDKYIADVQKLVDNKEKEILNI
ncbi:MAG TPA: ribosome recycling factor [Spirochaetota bacterium]|nr:ribosome recycling factor [Spirochaetota bacterium]HNT11526.1 ribosome recycling factor [Spirochaetota bacterium]HNV48933.1 ribosome recycling factor [Spirochaetota bacterium]HOS39907.1 ribosome recycling factor [Spirochaetota bacterium]HPI22722.1 ribosome recycling factor [Spirochaetota bacterium]